MNLSEYSSEVLGFQPAIPSDLRNVQKVSQGSQPNKSYQQDASTNIHDSRKSVHVQCDSPATATASLDLKSLTKFFAKTYPLIHQQLTLPAVPVDWNILNGDTQRNSKVTTKLITCFPPMDEEYAKEAEKDKVLSAWLSTSPAVLALSWRPLKHELYCDHQLQQILIFSERKGNPIQKIPIRACASILYATDAVKNVLVAGTVLGDILVYKINKASYSEMLSHSTGGGVITTMNWFKSLTVDNKLILISSHSDLLKTWFYDERQELCTQGNVYSTDLKADELNPISIIETISESSFFLYWQHGPLLLHDMNNHTTSKEMTKSTILVGTVCKGICPLAEILKLKFVMSSGPSGEDLLYVMGKQGDIYVFFINKGTIRYMDLMYRLPSPNILDLQIAPQLKQIFSLNTRGELELFSMVDGSRTETATSKSVKHISLTDRNDKLLVILQTGTIEIFNINGF